MTDAPPGEPTDLIRRYYDSLVLDEWGRLERHPLEFALTLRALADWLPPPPAAVLDCGSGPGRYALELARQGYQVTLMDLSPLNLAHAEMKLRRQGLAYAAAHQGDAADLGRFADASFEAILLMGPLYHLTTPAARRQALQEAFRALRPGGMLLAAFVSQYAGLRYLLKNDPDYLVNHSGQVESFWRTGSFPPVRQDGSEFIAYFIPPAEVRPLIEAAGFEVKTVLALEGIASLIDERLNQAAPPVWQAWVELNYRLASDPSIHGACEHLLAAARKPQVQGSTG